jgi:hypothetical protein
MRRQDPGHASSASSQDTDTSPQREDRCWSVLVNDKQFGPLDFSHLAKLAREGALKPDSLVWRAGLQTWVAAETVGGLFAPAAAPTRKDAGLAEISLSPADRLPHVPTDDAVTDGPIQPPAAGPEAKRANYFLRHWRGELSLPVSYWLNGWLANLVTIGVVTAIAANLNLRDDFVPALSLMSVVSIWLAIGLILGWQVVGTWRAAIKYRAQGKTFWGGAAQVLLIIAVIRTLFEFGQTGIPQIREFYDIMAGDARVGKYTFRVLRDGQELEFAGGISFGAAKEFERFLDAMGGVRLIHLNSTGGRIREAQKMGDLIRSRKLGTYVSNECLSACTIIFLSGQERLVSADASIGFHQPYFPGLTADERRSTIAAEEARLRALGLSAEFAHKANQAPPDAMWFPSTSELIAEKVATRLVDADAFALSGFAPSEVNDADIEQEILKNDVYAAIHTIDPPTYEKILAQFRDGLRLGRTMSEVKIRISPHLYRTFLQLLPDAPNDDLIAYAQFMETQISALNNANAADCYYYMHPEKTDARRYTAIRETYKELVAEQLKMEARVILGAGRAHDHVPIENQVPPRLSQIYSALQDRFGADAQLLRADYVAPEKYGAYCQAISSMYSDILKLPHQDAATILRYLVVSK